MILDAIGKIRFPEPPKTETVYVKDSKKKKRDDSSDSSSSQSNASRNRSSSKVLPTKIKPTSQRNAPPMLSSASD
jgi:hypothetical protein